MGYDPTGHLDWIEALLVLGSVAMIVAGTALCVTGAGGILGGVLLAAGASSLINGFVNESLGGSFCAGWVGGAVSGALCGVGAGLAAPVFQSVITASGFAASSMMIGSAYAFAGGFLGNFAGTYITATIDREKVDIANVVGSSILMGTLNIMAGVGSAFSDAFAKAAIASVDSTSNVIGFRLLAGSTALLTELSYDTFSLILSYFFD